MSDYATDGRCHNAEPGTYGHECGRPAEWVGTKANGFRSGFCGRCKERGYEAREFGHFERITPEQRAQWRAERERAEVQALYDALTQD